MNSKTLKAFVPFSFSKERISKTRKRWDLLDPLVHQGHQGWLVTLVRMAKQAPKVNETLHSEITWKYYKTDFTSIHRAVIYVAVFWSKRLKLWRRHPLLHLFLVWCLRSSWKLHMKFNLYEKEAFGIEICGRLYVRDTARSWKRINPFNAGSNRLQSFPLALKREN